VKKKLCRLCNHPLEVMVADLGMSPLSNAYIRPENLQSKENFYPLHVYICENCYLMQLEEFESPDQIFNEQYAYFSSYSNTWLKHSEDYANMMINKFGINKNSKVIELASNDGYLLQFFAKKDIPVLGIEPSANVADIAMSKGIPTLVEFFGKETAKRISKIGNKADLIAANNVLAHVPDLNDFVAGIKIILKSQGVVTIEFPHLLNLMKYNQFDTIYHEHFSYFSLYAVKKNVENHGLKVFDVEELPTHGGSLRIYLCHDNDSSKPVTSNVNNLLDKEDQAGLRDLKTYIQFHENIKETKRRLLEFLIQAKREGKKVIGYGAPAKGNTLLNYCGIRSDFIDFTVDTIPYKQGLYLPGTHIPIKSPDVIQNEKPDYIIILPWNFKDEILQKISFAKDWGCRFFIPIPGLQEVFI